MHDPGALGAQLAQHFGQRRDPALGEHAEQLAPGAGRVGERAQQIEQGAQAHLLAHRGDMAHGRMMARRHQETEIVLDEAAQHQRLVGGDIDAERGQHVGGP